MAKTYRTGEPYALAGKRMPFINWLYVRQGRFGWYDESGKNVSVSGDLAADVATFRSFDQPWGIRLRADQATRGQPIVTTDRPYEQLISIATILHHDGMYRGWGHCRTVDGARHSIYVESEDGWTWQKPNLGLIEYQGSRANNFIEDYQGTVFIDPSAPPEERFKSIAETYFPQEQFDRYAKRRPDDIDPLAFRTDIKPNGKIVGAGGWVSPDGLHWTAIEEPLVVMHTDTQVVCYYDTRLRKYVGYFRDWMIGPEAAQVNRGYLPSSEANHAMGEGDGRHYVASWLPVGRRSIGRAETDDFRNFPLSDLILEPRNDMRPNQLLYTNCKTTFPGADDQHLMFPAIWDIGDDTTSIDMATSHDGRIWNWVPDAPVFATGTPGEWDGGTIFSHPNLVELKDGTFALPYTGYDVPHKYPRGQWDYATGYATWPKGRVVGVEADERGEFSTVAVLAPGTRLRVNAVTKRGGSVQVEVATLNGEPVAGRTFEDAVPLVGDCYRTPVRWHEHDDLGIDVNEPVILRFRLDRATLYFVDFE